MKELNVGAKTVIGEVVAKGSAANRAMNAGSADMKYVRLFMLAYDAFSKIADCNRANLKIASENVSRDATGELAQVARNIAAYLPRSRGGRAAGCGAAGFLISFTLMAEVKISIDRETGRLPELEVPSFAYVRGETFPVPAGLRGKDAAHKDRGPRL